MPDQNGPSATSVSAVHATAYGQVQGVGFRYFAKVNAQRLGVVGWVRNRDDGTVELWAEGTRERLDAYVRTIRRGPTHGRVARLDLDWRAPLADTKSFRIRY